MDMASSNLDPSTGMTCITCRVVFARNELQRDHYKTDWHRYNLKRKVAELPPVDAEQFQKRVLAHREQVELEAESQSVPNRCVPCNKTFQSVNAYDNHLNAKKHKEMAAIFERDGPAKAKKPQTNVVDKAAKMEQENAVVDEAMVVAEGEDEAAEDGEWTDEDSNEDETELTAREGAIPTDKCFFCLAPSSTLEKNLEHMSQKHGFYIPDLEFCSDLEGLVKYFGAKVGAGFMCLWCNEKGRRFRSLDACQKHMRDKGHCRAAHEGQDMLELADFYDFSSMYPEDQQGDQEVPAPVELLDDSGWQLQLPSGATVGHRELMRYYRQRLKPEGPETRNQKRGRDAIQKVMGQYKSLGWIGTTGEMAVRKARDVRFMQRIQAKSQMRLGVKGNKLFKYETYC